MNTQGFTRAKQNERRCSRHPLQHTGELYKKKGPGHQDNQVDKSNLHICRLSLRCQDAKEVKAVRNATDLGCREVCSEVEGASEVCRIRLSNLHTETIHNSTLAPRAFASGRVRHPPFQLARLAMTEVIFRESRDLVNCCCRTSA